MQVEQEIPREALLVAAREKIHRTDPEKAEFIARHIDAVCDALPQAERRAFLDDPVEFVSQERLFRGMSADKISELFQDGEMKPLSGQFGSRAVFETDSPLQALSFESGIVPAIAVIDRAKIVLNGELLAVGSPEYRQAMETKLKHPPQVVAPERYAYEVQNVVDTETRVSLEHNWHNLELRSPQPLSTVNCFIIDRSGQPPLVLYPDVPADRDMLMQLYSSELAAVE